MSRQHREALAHLTYGVRSSDGFTQLTGEVGTGKTTICRCLVERLPEQVDVALVLNPRVTALELVATLCDELKIAYPKDTTSIKVLTDVLNAYLLKNHAAGRRTVLIIDEAQCLSAEALEQVRLLTNLETSTTKLLQIILVGQPELRELLARDDLRQLAQRITARFHLMPFSRAETAAYIRHRLELSGARSAIFDERVIDLVHQLSKGVPRLINVLCDRAMLGAFAEGVPLVNSTIMRKAAAEVLPAVQHNGKPSRSLWQGLALALLLGTGLAVALWYSMPRPDDRPGGADLAEAVVQPVRPPSPSVEDSPVSDQAPAAEMAVPVESTSGLQPSEQPGPEQTPVVQTAPEQTAAPQQEPEPNGSPLAASEQPASEQAPLQPPGPFDMADVPEPGVSETPPPAVPSLAERLDGAGADARARAWAGLYRLWGYDSAAATDEQACAQAPAAGLSCLQGAGSWGLLRRFDRPAVLLLQAGGGAPIAVLLRQVDGDRVMLEVAGEEFWFSRAEVEQSWYGDYRLLWKKPPSGKTLLLPGMRDADVRWLRERLNRISGRVAASADPTLYDELLASEVRALQIEHGLLADGFAGPHTLIVLNNLFADPEIPHLGGFAKASPE